MNEKQIRHVDYDHVLQIVERLANMDKSAREVYNTLIFAFGK
jgi:hypothetical protein